MRQLFTRCVSGAAGTGLLLITAACSPALDWREVRLPLGEVAIDLPCRPSVYERSLQLGADRVRMGLQACRAGGVTWAIAHVDVVDPARVSSAMAALRASALANIDGRVQSSAVLHRPGFTPNPQSAELTVIGRLPDGRPATTQLAFFVVGTAVFQASAVAESASAEWATMRDSIRARRAS